MVSKPALMLSGGATLGLFHKLCKALLEQDLLPKVLSGVQVRAQS